MLREAGGKGGAGGGALGANVGVSGLKALGVKDLTYKTAFLACNVASGDARVRRYHFESEHARVEADLNYFGNRRVERIFALTAIVDQKRRGVTFWDR